MNVVRQVKENLSIFKNLYDILRIVDPVSKKVIYTDDETEEAKEQFCYCFWGKDAFCSNCVTMRAQIENDTFVKLETRKNKVYMIISTPISIDDSKYIVELLKDISDKGFLNNESILRINSAEKLIIEMNDKIIRDALTGIYNRRYINERLQMEVNKSIAEGQPLSVIMADIDFFKVVNDTYGHSVGDKILVDFAKLLEGSIRRNTDWAGRFGGEEFLVVLNNTSSEECFSKAENIRKLIENTVFRYDDIEIKITSSFGIGSTGNDNISAETLIANADENLYRAKKSGRNKTVKEIVYTNFRGE
jgi:diguanylate cyclase (GGDEF)-like protein